MAVQYNPTSHENLPHDSIDSLGYDWERGANPTERPKYPFKIYLPRTTEDIIAVVNEARQLGQTLGIRSRGHSSNDLVLVDKGAVLCTEKLNKVIELDPRAMTVKVQAGVVLASLDEMLAKQGYGLPVVGDHDDITAGGFASVGGISPTSHRYGMFVDNIAALEYVNWDGEPIRCSKTENRDEFYRLLTGTGQYGVIVTVTLNIVRVHKYRTILKNDRKLYIGVNAFVEGTTRLINDPGDTLMQRASWFDFAEGRSIGQISAYKATPPGRLGALTNTLSYGYLHTLGFWAGRLPEKLDVAVKYLGTLGLIFAPGYASIKNVERFSDRVLDASVGDPSRFLITLAPAEVYPMLFDKLYTLCRSFRTRDKCFTFITLSVKGIRSDYLSNGDSNKPFCYGSNNRLNRLLRLGGTDAVPPKEGINKLFVNLNGLLGSAMGMALIYSAADPRNRWGIPLVSAIVRLIAVALIWYYAKTENINRLMLLFSVPDLVFSSAFIYYASKSRGSSRK